MFAGWFARAGCPADVSHDTVRVIGVEVMPPPVRMVPGQVRGMLGRQRLEPVTHLGGTNELMTQVYDN